MITTEVILSPYRPAHAHTVLCADAEAARRLLEFFTAQINNDHTRKANLSAARLLRSQRLSWYCGEAASIAHRRLCLPCFIFINPRTGYQERSSVAALMHRGRA